MHDHNITPQQILRSCLTVDVIFCVFRKTEEQKPKEQKPKVSENKPVMME